jgi:hypothetical protein
VAVQHFPKDKLNEMLMADPESASQGQSASSLPDSTDTSRWIEVLSAGEDHPGTSISDDRARAAAILRKMREEGSLLKAHCDAQLLLLQNKEEASSSTIGHVASRVAGGRMEDATCSSLPGGVPTPRPNDSMNDKPNARPPPLSVWESSAQRSTSASPETPASRSEYQSMLLSGPKDSHAFGLGFNRVAQWAAEAVGAPLDPASPHLVDPGFTTPMTPSPIAQSEVLHLAPQAGRKAKRRVA